MKLSIENAHDRYILAMENGWRPPSEGEPNCSCHVNPPCSSCCLDGDYFDEWCEENNINLV